MTPRVLAAQVIDAVHVVIHLKSTPEGTREIRMGTPTLSAGGELGIVGPSPGRPLEDPVWVIALATMLRTGLTPDREKSRREPGGITDQVWRARTQGQSLTEALAVVLRDQSSAWRSLGAAWRSPECPVPDGSSPRVTLARSS